MKRQKINYWYLVAIAAGVAAIVVGIVLLKQKFFNASSMKTITFGADFYTEIYDASRRIHGMVSHINDLIEYVKKGFGFMFIFFGVVDICVFGSKITAALPEKDKAAAQEAAVPEQIEE